MTLPLYRFSVPAWIIFPFSISFPFGPPRVFLFHFAIIITRWVLHYTMNSCSIVHLLVRGTFYSTCFLEANHYACAWDPSTKQNISLGVHSQYLAVPTCAWAGLCHLRVAFIQLDNMRSLELVGLYAVVLVESNKIAVQVANSPDSIILWLQNIRLTRLFCGRKRCWPAVSRFRVHSTCLQRTILPVPLPLVLRPRNCSRCWWLPSRTLLPCFLDAEH